MSDRVRFSRIVTPARALFVTILLALAAAARADPTDTALDAIGATLAANDAAGALAAAGLLVDPAKLATLSPAQQIRAQYYQADADALLGQAVTAAALLAGFVPAAITKPIERLGFVHTGGIYGEQARALLASLDAGQGKLDQAAALYQALQDDYPQESPWPRLAAEALFSAGKYDAAAAAFDRFVSHFPNDPQYQQVWFRKADALRAQRRFKEEYAYLLGAPVQKGPDWEIIAGVRRAELLTQYLHISPGVSNGICQDLIAKYPNHPEVWRAHFRLGQNYLFDLPPDQRDPKQARAIFESLVRNYPNAPVPIQAQIFVGDAAFNMADYTAARAQYGRLHASLPDDAPRSHLHPMLLFMSALSSARLNDIPATSATLALLAARYPADPLLGTVRYYFSMDELAAAHLDALAMRGSSRVTATVRVPRGRP